MTHFEDLTVYHKAKRKVQNLQLTQQKGSLPHCVLFSTLILWSVGASRAFSFIYVAISQDIPWMSPWRCLMHFQPGGEPEADPGDTGGITVVI